MKRLTALLLLSTACTAPAAPFDVHRAIDTWAAGEQVLVGYSCRAAGDGSADCTVVTTSTRAALQCTAKGCKVVR